MNIDLIIMLAFGRKAMTNLDSIFKNRYIISPTWVSIVKTMVFLVVMHRCQKWIINKAEHWRIDAFELWCWQTLDSPLDSKEIKPVNLKRNQPWVFIRRTDTKAEPPIIWLSDVKSCLIGKDSDAGKDWEEEKKGLT